MDSKKGSEIGMEIIHVEVVSIVVVENMDKKNGSKVVPIDIVTLMENDIEVKNKENVQRFNED